MNIHATTEQVVELRQLVIIEHEHPEGLNECYICDEPLVSCAINKIKQLQAELEQMCAALKEDAARGAFIITNGEWLRFDDCAFLAIRCPPGADLSCKATRKSALDAAIKKAPPHA